MNTTLEATPGKRATFEQKEFEAFVALTPRSWLDVIPFEEQGTLSPVSHQGEDPWCLCSIRIRE